jgi:hypothetical protein
MTAVMTDAIGDATVREQRIEDVRMRIYEALAATGALPAPVELAALAGGAAELAEALATLETRRHIVRDDGAIAMAHPFATRSFGFSVMSETTLWWGGCAWDAFAIPHVVATAADALVATRCPTCDRALAWVVGRDAPPRGGEVALFEVPVERMWLDVIHTCSHQRLYCGDACVDRALAATGGPADQGSRLDLSTLWRLASRWYEGRLERGYTRRSPEAARAYFRSVGLDTPFWQR